MKRSIIVIILIVLLLVTFVGIGALFILLLIPIVYFINKYFEKREPPKVIYANTEEVESKYGEPDDVVVLDAARANELSALVLFYTEKDLMIIAGEEMKISDMISVTPKNLATPYTMDEYAVVINTKNPQRATIHLRVGYDAGLAREIASQIYAHI